MSGLQLLRLQIDRPALMRFAQGQGLLRYDDEGHGYALHAWLAAMFGQYAPRPFRLLEPRAELLGYSKVDAATLTESAQAFATPQAWATLVSGSLATKPMPTTWRPRQRMQIDVLACPVSRKDDSEKDIYLRTLDRLGDAAPPRAEVYIDWFRRQWANAVIFEHVELLGVVRRRLMRRGRTEGESRRPRGIERPQALFRAVVQVDDAAAFDRLLARGIGRHRAFGFGMMLLSPAP